MSNLSIKTKITIAMLIVGLVPVLIIGWISLRTSQAELEAEVIAHLESTAQSRTDHIITYLKQNIERFKLITSRSALRNTLESYNQEPTQEKANIMKGIIEAAGNSVEEIERVCILNLKGIIITSTDGSFCGKDVSEKDFFIKGKKENTLSLVEDDGEFKIFVSGPFILDGETIGVGITVVDLSYLEDIVKDRTGLGETGEVLVAIQGEGNRIYLFDRLFESKALEQAIESKETAEPMKQALLGKELLFQNSLDYRNELVLAASKYIDIASIGLVAKIDETEAFSGINEIMVEILLVSGLFVIFAFFIALIFSSRISRPIKKLHDDVEIIEKGDLDHKVGYEGGGEVGQLARTFDNMTVAIKKSRAEIDEKVKFQTEEIIDKQKSMEDSQKAILNILEDTEEEKELTKKERDKIDAILHSIGDGVFVVDENLNISIFNQIAADISGYSISEALGKKYSEILKFIFEKDGKTNDRFIKEAMATGEIKEMANHTLLIKKNGEKVAVADSAAPLKDNNGKVVGCVVVFRDVSQERAVDQAKTEFVSLASHQLRTPLSTINWYAEMLLAGDAGKVTKDQKDYLKEIYKGNQRMVELVNALLNVSRLELGTFSIEPELADLVDIANSVINEQKLQIKKKGHKLKTSFDKDLKKIKVDVKLIRIIFQNLISNAVKYTLKNGKISFKIEKLENEVLIQVADTGMGIPKSQQKEIFKKLFRADNVKETDTEGTGLGLYIIKSILDSTNGKIWFESEKNKGTTFSITIPLTGMKKRTGTKQLN